MTHPISVDTLIEPQWIVPVVPDETVLGEHAIAIRDGRIVALLPRAEARTRFAAGRTIALPGHVVLPGLINLHTHAAMSLLRGFADDLPLQRWLGERIWPAEGRFVGPAFVRDGTELACLEMIDGGVTCFCDMYFHAEEIAQAALATGIRAAIGIPVLDFPTRYASSVGDYLAKGLAARDRHAGEASISWCLAPHAPYSVSDAAFERIASLAAELDLPIHTHLHETAEEIRQGLAAHGCRPLARLERLGIIGPRTILAHAVHLTDDERDLLARHAASVAHCPVSNLKLASGIADMPALIRRHINWGLGTDGAASNNRLDIWQEMRLAALLAKVNADDASSLSAHEALHAATLGGAKALGLDDEIGSIEAGKAADLCAVRLDDLLLQPCYDPVSHLVYVAGREQVQAVWVAGKCLKYEGRLLAEGAAELRRRVELWHTRIADSARPGI